MKIFPCLKSPLFFILLIFIMILGFIGFNKINNIKTVANEEKQLATYQIAKIKSNLIIIKSSPALSSNPHDYIKAHKSEYDEIVQMGNPVVDYFVSEFKSGNLDGSTEWITAWICNEILGDKNPIKIWSEDHKNGWDSGRDWYEKYTQIL
ncbi:hypothetical protein G9F72_023055 [Clostridium estertheticum]|uniref:hypothetical protein n=1 Tax=Clostridium estertheticum TaxID=238834 RepID=UPI0013E97932|nr:hypothetical protein [Clostridium estertheticum]MBZ9689181.1 hypothetical protein [Clostridium estertheticum]